MAGETIRRNNNPGAIEDGPFARRQRGYQPGGGRFASFATPEDGVAAQEQLLRTSRSYRNRSAADIVQTYAPISHENPEANVRNYIGYIAARTGLDPTKPVPAEHISRVAAAMREFETGDHRVRATPYAGQLRPVRGNASQVPNAGPGGTLPPHTDVSGARPGAAETTQMNEGSRFQIRDPFQSGPELAQEGQTVETRAGQFDQMVSGAIDQLNQIQPQREAALRTAVDTKTKINDEMRAETQELISRARPLFQRREAIAARQDELANMSPFARAIHGTFDPNYNAADLRGRDRATAGELEVLASNYQYLSGLQETLGRLVDADYNNNDAIWRLQTENITQDLQLMSQSVGASQTVLSASMQNLENQTGLIRAQATARTDILNQMTVGQVNVALDQARSGNTGYATVNGVPISIQELTARQQGFQEQQDALESRQMAIEGGRLDLATRYEDRLISHMTPQEMEAAIQNGGKYQDQQLDVAKLTQTYGQLRARQEQQAQDIVANSAPGIMRNMIGGVQNSYQGTTRRMLGMFGNVPDEQRQVMSIAATEIQAITEGFTKAEQQGVGAQYAQQNLPRLQQLYQQQDKIIGKVAERWAGNNKDLRAVGEAWLRGAPLSSEAAVRGLIVMARSGVPVGTKLSGPAAQAFRMVQRIIQQNDTPQAGQSMEQLLRGGTKESKEQRDRELIQRVQGALGGAYNDRLMDEIVRATPQLAHQVAVNGRPHPFSSVRGEDFQNAVAYGDREGYSRLGREIGLNAEQTQQMFSQGANGPIWKQVREHKGWDQNQFGVMGQRLLALQTQLMMQSLDSSHSARPGFRPSQAYTDLVNNQQFQGLVVNVVRNQGQGSFGDYLTSTVAGPGFGESFSRYALGTRQAYITLQHANLEERTRQAQSIAGDPFNRAGMVLHSMEGVNPSQANALLSAIRPMIHSQSVEERVAVGFGSDSAADFEHKQSDIIYNQIESLVQNHHFDDPQLEAIRRRVASQWPQRSDIVSRIVRYVSGGGER